MRAVILFGFGWLLLCLAAPATIPAFELEEGIFTAGVIDFPTALDQVTTHTFHGSIELTDIAAPELNMYNLRYGLQLGSFQLLTDLNWTTEPEREFDYAEIKGKLQVLQLEEFRTFLALGLLGRAARNSEEREARIDDRPASLFAITSIELFPFESWGGILFNFYLDNRYFNLGLKGQIYNSIQLVGEMDYLHSTLREEKVHGKIGVSFEGLQNFYFQLIWTDLGKHLLAQVGTGF